MTSPAPGGIRINVMRTGINFEVTASVREQLLAVASDRNNSRKPFLRARIVLLTADGHGTEIMRQARVTKFAALRWQ